MLGVNGYKTLENSNLLHKKKNFASLYTVIALSPILGIVSLLLTRHTDKFINMLQIFFLYCGGKIIFESS